MEFDCNAVVITPLLCHVPWNIHRQGLLLMGYHMKHPDCPPFLRRYSRKAISGTSVVQVPKIFSCAEFHLFQSSEHFAVLVHEWPPVTTVKQTDQKLYM